MPSLLPAAVFALVALAGWVNSISVPTGKETPITPAKVTPRPTYRPPTSNPAPVVEYSADNPEPEPLDPSWAFVPVKYLNVLSAKSILYVPMTIRNPYPGQPKIVDATPFHVVQDYDNNYNYAVKVPKEKYKPRYYHPKTAQTYKVPTKGGYPKKAISDMKYYYYQKQGQQQYQHQEPIQQQTQQYQQQPLQQQEQQYQEQEPLQQQQQQDDQAQSQ